MMKLALINEKIQENYHFKYHSSIVKTTSHVENAEKVPNFAARWCLIRKYLIQSTASNHEKQWKKHQQNENTKHTYSRMKRNSNQPRQNHYYFYFYLKEKQTQENYAILAAKTTEDALGNFMKLSSLFDESNHDEHTITQQSIKTTPTIVMKSTHQSRTRENALIFATR
jgi:hypothetical protein